MGLRMLSPVMKRSTLRTTLTLFVAVLAFVVLLGTVGVDGPTDSTGDGTSSVATSTLTPEQPTATSTETNPSTSNQPSSATPTATIRLGEWPDDETEEDSLLDSGRPALSVKRVQLDHSRDVLPGSADDAEIVLKNAGNETGELRITDISVTGRENGLTEPESKVDDPNREGELPDTALGTLSITVNGSAPTYVVGEPSERVVLSQFNQQRTDTAVSLAPNGRATVRLTWVVPDDAGNVVQTDSVSTNVTVVLESG
jgi:hypothetical protein